MNIKNKKIAFFGTPSFTVEFLELLKNIGADVELIVTGEDKPVGRGMQMRSPGPKVFGDEHHIPVLQPRKLDEFFYNELTKTDWDLFIVIAYGKIIPEKIINLPKFGTLNLHYSLLPKYRGASPVESAILNGDSVTGLTIQQMVYSLDAGRILLQEKMNIEEDDTTSILRDRLNKQALSIFPAFLEDFFAGKIEGTSQSEEEVTKCGKFSKEDLNVTNSLNNHNELFRKYKAYDKKAYFFHMYKDGDMRVKITQMNRNDIIKVLPESRKEITKEEFESAFGKII